MKDILDQMEEHIAAIRNLQRNFDFHSKRLEKLMLSLNDYRIKNDQGIDIEASENRSTVELQDCSTATPQHFSNQKE
jgi:hypothetical protein